MAKLPTSRSDLMAMGATCVAEVSSETEERSVWTELSLWWIESVERPFFACVEYLHDSDGQAETTSFRAQGFGSWTKALKYFEESDLAERLKDKLPEDLETVFPDANEQRALKAAKDNGYSGDGSIEDILDWLYGDDIKGKTTHAIAKMVERDFAVPIRTVTNALDGKATTGWYNAFVNAMAHFNRKAFAKARKRQ